MAASYERRLAAVLCADVVGYTALMARDERRTIDALKDTRARVKTLVERRGGRVVDVTGDSILAVFPSAVECVRCAEEVQCELRRRNAEAPLPMELRIGLHLGDLATEDGSVYGDGVNIAARLQALAEASGVCLSGALLEQVQHHLDLRLESLGPQSVKNAAEPVIAYRLRRDERGDPEADCPASAGAASPAAPALFERPALAVLPFDNLTGDPAQEYFADGLCEDLITQLSLLRVLPVIARNSSFQFKSRPVDVQQVRRLLGVQYVVEGSVRKSEDRLRVSAQLIDASTGHHVWADRYDRRLEDLFGLQDEIAERIAASIHQQLAYAEPARVVRRSRPSLDAWDLAQRGWWHTNHRTRDDNARAQELFRAAVARDPEFVWARYGLVVSLSFDIFYQWTTDRAKTGLELFQVSQACLRLDPNDPHALLAMSIGHAIAGQRGLAIDAAERAVELSPSLAFAHYLLAFHLSLAGDPERALAEARRAAWLSPRDPILWVYLAAEASCHFARADDEAVIATCERVLRYRPDFPTAHALLAVSSAHLGRMEAARTHLDAMLAAQPEFTVPGFFASLRGARPEILERLTVGFRDAGLAPERF